MNIDDITIDFFDLIKKCMKKYKFIIVCMLIGGFLFNGVGCLRSIKDANEVKNQISQKDKLQEESEKLITINEYMQNLTERECAEVQMALSSYRTYQKEYLDCLNYYKGSVLMQLDPNSVPTMRLQYLIDNHYEVIYPMISKKDTTRDIISVFSEKLMSENVSKAIASELGMENNATFVQELVTTGFIESDILVINIVAESEADCSKIADVVKDNIQESIKPVKEMCGEFDIKLVSEKYFENVDKDLLSLQQTTMTSLNTLKVCMNNLLTGMTEEQKVYYYALMDNEETIDLNDPNEETFKTENEMPDLIVPDIHYINLKFILVGLILGIVFALGWLTIKYVVSKRLRIPEDIEKGFGIDLLGNVTDKTTKSLDILKKPYHLLSTDEQIQLIVSVIKIMVEKENFEKIFITSTAMTERTEDVCDLIEKEILQNGIECSYGKSALYTHQSIKGLSEADGVIFVEQIDESRYEDIAKEKEISIHTNTKIIGCVVVE